MGGRLKRIKRIFGAMFFLALLGIIGSGLYLLLKETFGWFAGLQQEVAASIIAGLTAVFVSVFTLVISKYFERKGEVRKEHREKKVPIYEDLMDFWFYTLFATQMGKQNLSQEEIIARTSDILKGLIVWGSDDVLLEYHKMRTGFMSESPQNVDPKKLLLLENLLLAIRKDLGHKNREFKRGIILQLWVNDLSKFIELE
jgi:hypothetical protein